MSYSNPATDHARLIYYRIGIALATALCVGWLALGGVLKPVDLLIYDWGQRLADRSPAEELVVVGIDDASISQLGRWPWSREYHAKLLEILHQAQVKAVALDIIFSEPDLSDPQADARLAEAILAAGNVFLPVYISQGLRSGQLIEALPIPEFAAGAAGLGHVHYENDSDGVCRSVFLKEGVGDPHWQHLAVSMAAHLGKLDPQYLPGERLNGEPAADLLNVQRDYRNLLAFLGRDKRYTSVSYIDILSGKVPDALLKDKIILVGATATGLGDRVVTPTSSDDFILNGVELNATIYQSLTENRFIRAMPELQHGLIAAFISLVLALSGAFLAPRSLMIFLFAGVGISNVAALGVLNIWNFWFPPTAISLGFLLSYLLWSLRRLQQALGYFRRELRQLAKERSLLQRPENIDGLYSGLAFLSPILGLKGWLVRGDRGTENSGGETAPQSSLVEPLLNRWTTQAGCSSIRFRCGEELYSLFLFWPERPDRGLSDVELETLNALVAPYTGATLADLPKAPEAITGAIVQLNRANESFREVSHFAQHSLARMADGVAITDRSGRVLFENEVFRKLLGISADHPAVQILELLQGLTPVMEESWRERLSALYLEGAAIQCEAVNFEQRHVLCQAHTLSSDSNEQFVIFVVTDISVLKEYQRARDETLNFLSHDLRSPMVSILALIELSRNRGMEGESVELLAEIESYANKNLKFADNFLQYARAEASETIDFELTDMHAVLGNALDEVFRQAESRDIRLEQAFCDEDVWVMGQSDLLERAVTNLLTNAIKFSNPQGVVTVGLEVDGEFAVCSVKDQGIGIPESELGSVFQRFQRASQRSKEKRSGTGLGLRFVDLVVRRHKGQISVESRPGEGTQFSIRLRRTEIGPG